MDLAEMGIFRTLSSRAICVFLSYLAHGINFSSSRGVHFFFRLNKRQISHSRLGNSWAEILVLGVFSITFKFHGASHALFRPRPPKVQTSLLPLGDAEKGIFRTWTYDFAPSNGKLVRCFTLLRWKRDIYGVVFFWTEKLLDKPLKTV